MLHWGSRGCLGGAALVALVGWSGVAGAQAGYGPPPTDPTEQAPQPSAIPQAGEGGAAPDAVQADPPEQDALGEEEAVEPGPAEVAPPPAPADGGGDDSDAVRPSTRPWIAEFGIGPSIFMLACASGDCTDLNATTQVKMSQFVGYHLSGDGEGFGLGLALNEAFGSGLFRFQPGLRLFADIPVVDDMAIYVSPYGQLGYSLYTASFGGASGSAHFFNWQLGATARVILGDRFALSFTPIGFDWVANGDGMIWAYDLAFGFGATF